MEQKSPISENIESGESTVKKTEIKMQMSNIDESGNVLYLDKERLDRKVVGYKRFKNPSNGLGVYNFVKTKVLRMSDKRWPMARGLYKFFIKKSTWLEAGGKKAYMYKRFIALEPNKEKNTSTVLMPLHVDITDKGQKVVVPMDLLKETLKKVKYIGGMDSCLCRESNDCKDYPKNLGCLFLGNAARTIEKHKLGRELTYEEACERIDKAAAHGLVAQAVWIEFEQALWGIRNDELDDFLEICFCCPCCCIAMRLSRVLDDEARKRFHPAGWTAVPDRTKCVGCGKCALEENGCPVKAITIGEDKKVIIDQEKCVGCGICKNRCKFDVISIKQTMPMRSDLGEYYDKEFNVGLKIWKDTEEVKQ